MTAPTTARAHLDPVTVFDALANPIRWRLILMMADGRILSATDAAVALGRQFDSVIKHLHTLQNAGLLHCRYKENDRRILQYYIPEVWRTEPEVLDFGFCILDLSALKRGKNA